MLYCYASAGAFGRKPFRLGWLKQATPLPAQKAGYKSLRRSLIDATEQLASSGQLMLVSGKTGSGKTHFINSLPCSIDLEGLANHRGSAFGRRVSLPPSQATFENAIGVSVIKAIAINLPWWR